MNIVEGLLYAPLWFQRVSPPAHFTACSCSSQHPHPKGRCECGQPPPPGATNYTLICGAKQRVGTPQPLPQGDGAARVGRRLKKRRVWSTHSKSGDGNKLSRPGCPPPFAFHPSPPGHILVRLLPFFNKKQSSAIGQGRGCECWKQGKEACSIAILGCGCIPSLCKATKEGGPQGITTISFGATCFAIL